MEKLGAIVCVPTNTCDLTKEVDIDTILKTSMPEIIFHLAADIGGISYISSNPCQVYFKNMMMNTLLIEKARINNIKKFVGINTVSCYPQNASLPLKEDEIWGGLPEENVAPYGLAKRMMIYQSIIYRKQFNFNSINLILDNIYGPYDNFDLNRARVIPALIRKFIDAGGVNAAEVSIWGTGEAQRSFLYVKDAVDGIVLATEKWEKSDPINIGSSNEIRIKELAKLIASITDYKGLIKWETNKPEGLLRRVMDVSKAKKELGFGNLVSFEQGLKETIDWYVKKNN